MPRSSTQPVTTGRAVPSYRDPVLLALAAGTSALLVLLVSARATRQDGAAASLDYAGPLTRELLPVARLAGELAAVAVVAGLLACLLAARQGPGGLRPTGLSRAVPAWALAWSAVSVASALLSASDISNSPVAQVLGTGLLLDYLTIIPQARTHAVTAVVALAVAALAWRASRSTGGPSLPVLAVLLLATAAGLAYPLTTGHSASAANHYLAVASLLVHVLAATAWVGGLAGLVVHLRDDTDALRLAVGRFDGLALTAFVVVAASGAANAWTRVPEAGLLTTTTYGWLLLAKVVALVVLGGFGAWHRRATIRRLRTGEPRAFRRLAAVEVAVMTATVGLAVTLSRTPTP